MLYNTFEEAVKTYKTGTPGEKGLLTGVIVTEIIAAAMGVAELRQAAKLAKAGQMTRTMEKLIERPVMQAPARQTLCSRLRDKLKAFREWIDPWCFVAGTLVATPAGAVPIESVRAGDLVWSRDPGTYLTAPRPVRETYVSHPAELFHVGVDRDGDHRADETITGTGAHPWYVLTPGRVGFVPARELQAGDILSLRDGTRAWVADKTREVAPPGQTFTTYNFAVADHHTYFAGEGGVWVHNVCKKLVELIESHYQTGLRIAERKGLSGVAASADAADYSRKTLKGMRLANKIDEEEFFEALAYTFRVPGGPTHPVSGLYPGMREILQTGAKFPLKNDRGISGFMTKDGHLVGHFAPSRFGHEALASQLGVTQAIANGDVLAITIVRGSGGELAAFGSGKFGPLVDHFKQIALNLIE